MASATISEISSCMLCKNTKSESVFTCIRCSQQFCAQHMHEHRETFEHRLDELAFDHNQLLQQSHESYHHLSMAKIDEWERESIETIHQTADKMRRELTSKLEKHTNQFSEQWQELLEELKTTRDNNNFMEIDLQQLLNKLNKLKSSLASPPTISFQDHMPIFKPIIYTIPDDIFELFAGDLQIKDNGQLVEHGPSVSHAIVRGSGEYSSGEHRFQFKIETYNINKWIFFGIITHKAAMHSNTWAIPSCYRWGGQDSTILSCAMHSGLNGYSCDFELNDIVELLLDCDRRIIRLTNDRTKRTHVMNIDLVKCPFPWHFLLNLFYPNDQIRILYADIQ